MSIDEFQDLLDRLGDDVPGWPAAQRDAAEALLRTSPDAAARLEAARRMRAAFAATPSPAPAIGLADRIVWKAMTDEQSGRAAEQPEPGDKRLSGFGVSLPVIAILALLIMGFSTGLLFGASLPDDGMTAAGLPIDAAADVAAP
ncbi:hypothetical protein [Labrys wisconsinensis]|uniref:Uncharacterized protein n=1 Tax=Labrys wisconsinensis TaxID=425677 RepID=A0ABU0J8W3_9HYPH|nr:hypothetical protein [Labrys wisconsinensis]MDQ0470707.1 hypothetical protein [Labrys wisconsinensis]